MRPCELVDNHHLAFLYDILDISLVQGVGPQQLVHGMHFFGTLGVHTIDFVRALLSLLRTQRIVTIELRELRRQIGNLEQILLRFRKLRSAEVGQGD